MAEAGDPKESLEHVERAHELLEKSEHAALRLVPLIAAVLAVFAGLCGLYSGRLGEQALALRSEAVLDQTRASDAWNEYQADSLKAHLFEIGSKTTANSALLREFSKKAKDFRGRQPPLKDRALEQERERDKAFADSERAEERHVTLDVAVALFEIAIVLTSIAAMTKQPLLFFVAAAAGLIGVAFGLRGLFS